jgi:hypothetical protein
MVEIHGGPSGGHLHVNKTLDKFRQRYYWLEARNDVETGVSTVTPVQKK